MARTTDMATATQPTDMAMAPATVMDIRRDGSRSHSCEAGDGLGTNAVRQWGHATCIRDTAKTTN